MATEKLEQRIAKLESALHRTGATEEHTQHIIHEMLERDPSLKKWLRTEFPRRTAPRSEAEFQELVHKMLERDPGLQDWLIVKARESRGGVHHA